MGLAKPSSHTASQQLSQRRKPCKDISACLVVKEGQELLAPVTDFTDVVQPHLHLPMKVIWGEDGSGCLSISRLKSH